MTTSYRTEIDGLRAIAVLGVLAFHLHGPVLPGGFVGVDVFFVISGYLITSIILRELRAGTFSLSRFYQRRVARLLPQIAVVTGCTFLASTLVYGPEEIGAVGSAGLAGAISLANVKFMMQGDYFAFPEDIQPFLHFWSLSVEEQFYFVAPTLFLFAHRMPRLILWLGTIGVITTSLAASAYYSESNAQFAFYMLPTRAWELTTGCALAIYGKTSHSPLPTNAWTRHLPAVGVAIIIGSYALIHSHVPFPGTVAAAPVMGAALVIASTPAPDSLVARLLNCRAARVIGQQSFALYMWHWPITCMINYRLFAWATPARIALAIAVTAACTAASYKFIEAPLRKRLAACKADLRYWTLTACTVATLCSLGLALNQYFFNNVNVKAHEVLAGGVRFGDGARRVALIGDSKAGMYGAILAHMSEQQSFCLHVLSVHSSNPMPGNPLWDDIMGYLTAHPVDTVIIAEAWGEKLIGGNPDGTFARAMSDLATACDHIVVIAEPPILPVDCSRTHIAEHGMPKETREPPESRNRRIGANRIIRQHFEAADPGGPAMSLVDPAHLFEDDLGHIKFLDPSRRYLFYDRTHLSYYGTQRVRHLLREALDF
jgi:peptidoglycan/LPS O-acetylase OafA/YrhL